MAVLFGKLYNVSPLWLSKMLNWFFIILTYLYSGYLFASLTFSWFIPVYIFLGLFITDVISGTVHMLLDRFKLAEEHHEKPWLITQKPYFVKNGESLLFDICFWSLFPDYQIWIYAALFGIFVEINHTYQHEKQVPKLVRLLWDSGLFVSAETHNIHHREARKGRGKNYCMLMGMSEPLVVFLERFSRDIYNKVFSIL